MKARVRAIALVHIQSVVLIVAACFCAYIALRPMYLGAQASLGQSELSQTIKQAIMSDVRSGQLSEQQIDRLAVALALKAQEQGMTSHDILWRPALAHTMMAAAANGVDGSYCGDLPNVLCELNQKLGRAGADPAVPVMLGVAFAIVLALSAAFLELRHRNKVRNEAKLE